MLRGHSHSQRKRAGSGRSEAERSEAERSPCPFTKICKFRNFGTKGPNDPKLGSKVRLRALSNRVKFDLSTRHRSRVRGL